MHITEHSLRTLKAKAKKISQTRDISYLAALEAIAEDHGFNSWSLLSKKLSNQRINAIEELWQHLFPSQLISIAARRQVGKVSFAINILLQSAKQGYKTAYFPYHESRTDVQSRLVAIEAKINQNLIKQQKNDKLDEQQLRAINQAINNINSQPIDIYPEKSFTLDYLSSTAIQNKGYSLIIIDDITQLLSPTENQDNLSLKLKEFTRKNQCSLLLISQLIDHIDDQSHPQTTKLQDMVDGEILIRHCDLVLGLQRDTLNDDNMDNTSLLTNLSVLKSKKSMAGDFNISLDKQTGIFS